MIATAASAVKFAEAAGREVPEFVATAVKRRGEHLGEPEHPLPPIIVDNLTNGHETRHIETKVVLWNHGYVQKISSYCIARWQPGKTHLVSPRCALWA